MRTGTHPLDKKPFTLYIFDEYGSTITEQVIYAQSEERARSEADKIVYQHDDAAYYELMEGEQ